MDPGAHEQADVFSGDPPMHRGPVEQAVVFSEDPPMDPGAVRQAAAFSGDGAKWLLSPMTKKLARKAIWKKHKRFVLG